MGLTRYFWAKGDQLVNEKKYSAAEEFFQEGMEQCKAPQEFAELGQKLFDIRKERLGKIDKTLGDYALFAARGYLDLFRISSAVALLRELRKVEKLKAQCLGLEDAIVRAIKLQKAKEVKAKRSSSKVSKQAEKSKVDNLEEIANPEGEEIPEIVYHGLSNVVNPDEQLSEPVDMKQSGFALLSKFTKSEIQALFKLVKITEMDSKKIVFKEGDQSEAFYVVVEGKLLLENSRGLKKELSEGDFFGEFSLFGRTARTATVKTELPSKLLQFDRKQLEKAFQDNPSFKRKVHEFLCRRLLWNASRESPLLKPLDASALEKFFSKAEKVKFSKGNFLLKAEEKQDAIMLIVSGRADLLHFGEAVSELGPGRLLGDVRPFLNASVVAKTDVEVLQCSDDDFVELLADYPKVSEAWLKIMQLG